MRKQWSEWSSDLPKVTQKMESGFGLRCVCLKRQYSGYGFGHWDQTIWVWILALGDLWQLTSCISNFLFGREGNIYIYTHTLHRAFSIKQYEAFKVFAFNKCYLFLPLLLHFFCLLGWGLVQKNNILQIQRPKDVQNEESALDPLSHLSIHAAHFSISWLYVPIRSVGTRLGFCDGEQKAWNTSPLWHPCLVPAPRSNYICQPVTKPNPNEN